MGSVAYFPLAVVVAVIGYVRLKEAQLGIVLPALEFTLPVFAAWWSIFLFYDVLEEEGTETILSYPLARWKLGALRVGVFFLGYFALVVLVVALTVYWSGTDAFFPLVYQLGVESFFFAAVGFFTMVVTANSGWSLVVLIVYTSTQLLTEGHLLPFTNVYLFNNAPVQRDLLREWSVYVLAASGALFLTAQWLLQRMQRFN